MIIRTALCCVAALGALTPAAFAERGSDGQVNIIYWQAPSTLNPYLSGGRKESEAASLVIEPLVRYDETGQMIPWLVTEIPTVANGGVAEDLTSITWTLDDTILWSDGSPISAEDVKFTADYCMDPEGGCAQASKFEGIDTVEVLSPTEVKITFTGPTPFPYAAFSGAETPILQKAQFENCLGAAAPSCTEQNFGPIGTGPFTVTEFRPNDVISFTANDLYRDPAKPAFATVNFKGGGDAQAAARAVMQTGEFDYAWNLQLAPEVIASMQADGLAQTVAAFGPTVERIMINLTDPDPALGDARATAAHPHPFLGDKRVREALSKAIDRAILVEVGYGDAGKLTCNVLPAPAIFASTANDSCLTQDIDGANALLDEAGWIDSDGDGIRDKDGMALSILFHSSTNAVRQDFQALIKQWWEDIGIEVELRNIDPSVYFGGDVGSPDTLQKFFADVQMYANTFSGTDPQAYMGNWLCDKAPRPETQWQGENMPRFCDPAYDALHAEMTQTADLEERARLARAMNDMLMQDFIILPLVHRGRIAAHANSLGGVVMNVWDSELWNIADWYRVD